MVTAVNNCRRVLTKTSKSLQEPPPPVASAPDDVEIHETAGESVVILEIRVAQDDVGKVIGKDGRIANAIRTVVKASAAKNDKKVTVEILTKQ